MPACRSRDGICHRQSGSRLSPAAMHRWQRTCPLRSSLHLWTLLLPDFDLLGTSPRAEDVAIMVVPLRQKRKNRCLRRFDLGGAVQSVVVEAGGWHLLRQAVWFPVSASALERWRSLDYLWSALVPQRIKNPA